MSSGIVMAARECIVCSASFAPVKRNGRKYCSDRCRYQRTRMMSTCEYCLKSFAVAQSRQLRFCSKAHAALGARVGSSCEVEYRACVCGRVFVVRLGRVYCQGSACLRDRQRVKGAARYVARPSRVGPCAECGAETIRRAAGGDNLFCSDRCSHRAAKRLRRHALRTRPHEVIGLSDIAERDGWRCQLCRRSVRPGRAVPDPRAGTLDHIIPVAEGGAHVRANVQLAHFICNSRRRTDGTVQLRWAS